MTAADELRYFTEIGMFVFHRWQQIASDAGGGPLDETRSAGRWDDCTDRDVHEYRARTRRLIRREVGRLRALAFVESMAARFEPVRSLARIVGWAAKTVGEHFVGALGLLLFGLLFVWAAPHVAKEVRSTLDEVLPDKTRPDEGVVNKTAPIGIR